MPEQAMSHPLRQLIASEGFRLEGALEVLDSLHADLILRLDQVRDESAREAFDEILTLVDSLLTEYRRRQAALPPVSAHHASYVFLLDEHDAVHPLPHRVYVALVRGEAATPQFAGKTLRLAEWYVRLQADEPETVVNETYALLTFDREGRADWSATPSLHPHRPGSAEASETAELPSAVERERMWALLFGGEIEAL
ncbi:MAG: hypothetical protein Q8K35_02025 [Thiobacillus sp.]|nr:hypothetical protein [Thiobacillus sp.]